MKIKQGFILRELLDQWVVMPVGQMATDYQYMIALNETGAGLWKQLASHVSADQLVDWMCGEYEVERELARTDVNVFLKSAREKGVLEE